MKSISSSFACEQRRDRQPDELVAWAKSLVRHPQRYSATRREASIVATLLVEVEAAERTWCWECAGSGKRYAGNGRWDTCQACGGTGGAR